MWCHLPLLYSRPFRQGTSRCRPDNYAEWHQQFVGPNLCCEAFGPLFDCERRHFCWVISLELWIVQLLASCQILTISMSWRWLLALVSFSHLQSKRCTWTQLSPTRWDKSKGLWTPSWPSRVDSVHWSLAGCSRPFRTQVDLAHLGTSWHILAHLGTSWHRAYQKLNAPHPPPTSPHFLKKSFGILKDLGPYGPCGPCGPWEYENRLESTHNNP